MTEIPATIAAEVETALRSSNAPGTAERAVRRALRRLIEAGDIAIVTDVSRHTWGQVETAIGTEVAL